MSSQREDRPGWATSFKVGKKTEDWQCDFTGVIALQGIGRFWVNVWKRIDRNGQTYLSINLRPKFSRPPGQADQRKEQQP